MDKENENMTNCEMSDDELEQVSGGEGRVLKRAPQYCYLCQTCMKRAFFRKDWSTLPIIAYHKGCGYGSNFLIPNPEDNTGPYYQIDMKDVIVVSGYNPPADF